MKLGSFDISFNRHSLMQFSFDGRRIGVTLGFVCKRPNTGYDFAVHRGEGNFHVDGGPFFFIDLFDQDYA